MPDRVFLRPEVFGGRSVSRTPLTLFAPEDSIAGGMREVAWAWKK